MLKSTAGGNTFNYSYKLKNPLVSHTQEMVKIKENTSEGLLKYKIKI